MSVNYSKKIVQLLFIGYVNYYIHLFVSLCGKPTEWLFLLAFIYVVKKLNNLEHSLAGNSATCLFLLIQD